MQFSLDWKISTKKKKVDLDEMDNLDTLKKLVSTLRTFSILISIGLDCRDPQAYIYVISKLTQFWYKKIERRHFQIRVKK
jgi:hypothetical protein